ncbi:MAG: 50S ribosomal protein L21 [Actinobacteria bacterium]|nr:50S ribosomal protein L21 [Actinomycetota bacterium]
MYAIIKYDGKQYKVSKGDQIVVDQIKGSPGDKFDITDVVMVRDDRVLVDNLDKAKVIASIVEHFRGDKIIVFKYKPKKNYRRKFGHRSYLTKIKIEDIRVPKAKAAKEEASKEAEATA